MLTVTFKSKPNDTSTVTVSYASEHLVYAFPHDSPSESVIRACGFAEVVARSNGQEAAVIIINMATAEHRHHGIVRSGSAMAFASSLLRGGGC
jgi:peroxiredoxin